jgi:hypothetical protein
MFHFTSEADKPYIVYKKILFSIEYSNDWNI